jgi:hypothetical protein
MTDNQTPPKVRRGRGLGKKPRMRHITMRLPQHVLDYYDDDILAMRNAWVKHTEEKINAEAPE